jgi:hypothetical protein
MEDKAETKLCETWDRLVLLLISSPRSGWEAVFEEIIHREFERLSIPSQEITGGDDDE